MLEAAGGFANGANTVLLVVTILATALAVVSGLAGFAVYLGGSWRKSEMDLLRKSREDLTLTVAERDATILEKDQQLTMCRTEITKRDEQITDLTGLVTSRQPFEQMVTAQAKHSETVLANHERMLALLRGIDSKLGTRQP